MNRSWFRRALNLVLALLVALGGITVVVPSPAQAAVGRPNNAEVEIEAYYNEFLGRPSDPGGYTGYRDRMWNDCRHGVLSAGMMIGDSLEAHNRWRTPNEFVPAMYRALLNRHADPGGHQTYVNVINHRGYRWAIRDIQASSEFRNRLAAMCNGRRGIATQNQLPAVQAIGIAIGINDAGMTLIKACAVGSVISLTGGLAAKTVYQASKNITAARWALESAISKGAAGACLSAIQVLRAADDIATTARYEPGSTNAGYNNPTYAFINMWESWEWNGRWCHVQMGGGPSAPERSWRQVKFRCI